MNTGAKTVLLIAFVLLLIATYYAAAQQPDGQQPEGPQFKFRFDRMENDSEAIVVPTDQVYFRLQTRSNLPLKHGDYMLCHLFDIHDATGEHVGLRCGQDQYALERIGIYRKKER